MIEKLKITKAKFMHRMFGIGLTKAEEAMALKINEIIDELNKRKM